MSIQYNERDAREPSITMNGREFKILQWGLPGLLVAALGWMSWDTVQGIETSRVTVQHADRIARIESRLSEQAMMPQQIALLEAAVQRHTAEVAAMRGEFAARIKDRYTAQMARRDWAEQGRTNKRVQTAIERMYDRLRELEGGPARRPD